MSGANGTLMLTELDPALVARLQRTIARLEPDPLFRRRLRGEILNRHVAAREGLIRTAPRSRQMGRLGRATLYASVGLAVSVTGAGAASQQALPGDALYSLKLRLEEIRMQIAPASMRGYLAVLALDERLDEVEVLARAGAWSRVETAAAQVTAAERRVEGYAVTVSGTELAEIHRHVAVIEQLLLTAPEAARPGLRTALEASTTGPGAPGRGNGPNAAHGNGKGSAGSGAGSGGNGSVPPPTTADQSPSAAPSARPSRPPQATPAPAATAQSQASGAPAPDLTDQDGNAQN
ncbi:MAG TPA: hypothetical protein VF013_07360 [Candidatus Limnocylindria bacterium]